MAVVAGAQRPAFPPAPAPTEPTLHIESPYRPGAGGSLSHGPYTPPEGRPLSRMRRRSAST